MSKAPNPHMEGAGAGSIEAFKVIEYFLMPFDFRAMSLLP
jgi:hypothetical protein